MDAPRSRLWAAWIDVGHLALDSKDAARAAAALVPLCDRAAELVAELERDQEHAGELGRGELEVLGW